MANSTKHPNTTIKLTLLKIHHKILYLMIFHYFPQDEMKRIRRSTTLLDETLNGRFDKKTKKKSKAKY